MPLKCKEEFLLSYFNSEATFQLSQNPQSSILPLIINQGMTNVCLFVPLYTENIMNTGLKVETLHKLEYKTFYRLFFKLQNSTS